MELNKIYNEDCLQTMSKIEENSIDLVLTSPPYNISRAIKNREYGLKVCNVKYKDYADNLTNDEYREWTTKIFNQFDRILKKDGVVLYNISYGTEQIEKAELMWFVITDILSKTPFTVADCIVWKKQCPTLEDLLRMAQWKDEEHAKEKQQWIIKACEWWKNKFTYPTMTQTEIDYIQEKIENFKNAMKGELEQ